MIEQGRSEEFRSECERLHQKGNFVVLIAGANFMFDDLYLFEEPTDAERFYQKDFAGRESMIDDKPCGFQEISLYRHGKLVSTKAQPSSDDQSAPVNREQSQKELATTDNALESGDNDLLKFE
jgi:hypothetical protein